MNLQKLAMHFVYFTIGTLIGLALWDGVKILFQLIRRIKNDKDQKY